MCLTGGIPTRKYLGNIGVQYEDRIKGGTLYVAYPSLGDVFLTFHFIFVDRAYRVLCGGERRIRLAVFDQLYCFVDLRVPFIPVCIFSR